MYIFPPNITARESDQFNILSRHCFRLFMVLVFITAMAAYTYADDAPNQVEPPYRGWYQPAWMVEEPELYEYANLHLSATGGDFPLEQFNQRGIAVLGWTFGPQAKWAKNDPDWFRDSLHPRSYQGRAIDEWNTGMERVGNQKEAAAAGYRMARKKWPDNFVACWVTGPCELFIELMRDGTLDLAMVEGYHWWFDNPSVGGIDYESTLNRVQRLREAGVSNRTVVGWGHLSAGPDKEGRGMSRKQVERRVIESRERYPEMPGIVFMGSGKADNRETRKLIRYADRLSGEYYPDPPPKHKQEKVELPITKGFATEDQSTSEITDRQIILHAEGPDTLELEVDTRELSELDEEIVSAELVLSATEVDNSDRRVLQIFAGDADVNEDPPLDARIWYEPGVLRFNVTQALRELQSDDRQELQSFIITDIPTGWKPPKEENWRIVLARSDKIEKGFGMLEIHIGGKSDE